MDRRGISQLMGLMVGLVVLMLFAVLVFAIFSGNYGEFMENLLGTTESTGVDLCEQQVKGWCSYHAGDPWDGNFTDCAEHADLIYPDSGTTCPS